jgi:hypothetical protein
MYDMVSTLILDMDVLYDALTHYSLWWQHNWMSNIKRNGSVDVASFLT